MCEWLSHAEWCDVQIVCGGHSFSAHKAVLASVSNFLRHILLSFPSDESAISIVLPDFDLDAMTSVLSYIYNGEVKLDNQKLGLFFDIVNALQIFVDCQYLPDMLVGLKESKEHYLNKYCKKYQLVKDVFTLAIDNEDNRLLYNIKRCSDTQSIILQYTRTETEFQDGTARCQHESEPGKSRLGNLESSFGDRQRNSFLRDLFIETYPQNGNVNGRAEGVLAISNECYHSPASELSTNANGKHLGDDALSTTYKKSTNYSLHSQTIFHNDKQPFCTRNCNEHAPDHEITKPSTNSTNIFIYRSNNDCNDNFINSNRIQDLMTHSNMNNSFSTINVLQSDFQQCMMKFKMARPPTNSSVRSVIGRLENNPLKTLSSPKVIYNRVLQSPWCSRKPNDFRPFRRKVEKGDQEKQITEEKIVIDQNDNNNNVQSKPQVDNSHKMLETPKQEDNIKEASDASGHNSNGDSFTCSHCNQVLTSSESLAVHTRRHLTAARYSCTECGKTFSQLRNFKYHMSIHRGTREFAATCTVCGKYFNDRGYLSSHMKIHRNRKEYKCTQCPKSFNQRVAYNMHVRIHTGVKPHVCDECGKAFSRKMLLKQHQRTHSGERPYACPHCDKRFADRSNMTLHLRLHTGVKPFSCTMCPKSFTKKHHLKSHLNFHTGSKPYSCPRCKLAFTQSSNMRTHMKKCNAPLPSEGVDTAVVKINEVN